jgi:hypothetical protein
MFGSFVAAGYGRNYLVPRGFVLTWTCGNCLVAILELGITAAEVQYQSRKCGAACSIERT